MRMIVVMMCVIGGEGVVEGLIFGCFGNGRTFVLLESLSRLKINRQNQE